MSVAIVDEFYTFDLMTLNFKINIFFLLCSIHYEDKTFSPIGRNLTVPLKNGQKVSCNLCFLGKVLPS